jgi:hypothetical protein
MTCSAAADEAPRWIVQPESTVGFTAFQAGAPVEGLFESFEAEIHFDLAALEASRVAVVIDVASVNSQSQERDDTIRSAELFDVGTWPTARFEIARFSDKGEGATSGARSCCLSPWPSRRTRTTRPHCGRGPGVSSPSSAWITASARVSGPTPPWSPTRW